MVRCELGCLQIHIRSSKGMLDSLILANRSPEHDSFFRILGSFLQCHVAEPKGFPGKKTTLGVQSMENL